MQGEGRTKGRPPDMTWRPESALLPTPSARLLGLLSPSGQGAPLPRTNLFLSVCLLARSGCSLAGKYSERLCVKPNLSDFAYLWCGNGKFQACETDSCSDRIPTRPRRALAADPLSPCSPVIGARPGEGDKEAPDLHGRASRASPRAGGTYWTSGQAVEVAPRYGHSRSDQSNNNHKQRVPAWWLSRFFCRS